MNRALAHIKKLLKPTACAVSVTTVVLSPFARAEQTNWNFVPTFKSTIAITAPTEKVLGHRPGIETFVLVKNSLKGEADKLEMCDTVKINYRILDKDGDWADAKAISDSVQWFVFTAPKGQTVDLQKVNVDKYYLVANESSDAKTVPFDLRYRDFEDSTLNPEQQNLSLKLIDHIKLRKGSIEGPIEPLKLKRFIDEKNKAGESVYLGYEIVPYTKIGEPYEGSLTIVDQFQRVTRLKPELNIGEEQIQEQGDTVQNIFANYNLADQFQGKYDVVESNEIILNGNECLLPPTIKDSPYLVGYYLVQQDINDTEPVDYLVAGEKYIVQFFYDKNKNRYIDSEDENITEALLADGALDYLERPFENGLRIDIAYNLNGINLNAFEDPDKPINNSVFINPITIDNTGSLPPGVFTDTSVTSRGIPLDKFRPEFINGNSPHFFWIDKSEPRRHLYFETIDGNKIPDELLDATMAPKVLSDLFKTIDNAITLQGFILNVRSAFPKDYEPYETDESINDSNQIGGGQ